MRHVFKCSAIDYLEDYFNYYDKKSALRKRGYTILVILEIIISAFIPFTILFTDIWSSTRYIVAFMSSVVTILSALKTTFGFHKNWIEYRTTAETLRFHKYLFETRSAPYNGENREELLILKVNSIVERENRSWKATERSNQKKVSKNQN